MLKQWRLNRRFTPKSRAVGSIYDVDCQILRSIIEMSQPQNFLKLDLTTSKKNNRQSVRQQWYFLIRRKRRKKTYIHITEKKFAFNYRIIILSATLNFSIDQSQNFFFSESNNFNLV